LLLINGVLAETIKTNSPSGLLLAAAEKSAHKDCGLAARRFVRTAGVMMCWIVVHDNL
jgi:hypothetical protein